MKNFFTRSIFIASTLGCFLAPTPSASAPRANTLPPNLNASVVWNLDATLVGLNSKRFDLTGQSVAIDNNTIVVGAPNASTNTAISAGAAYVFVRSGNSWVEEAKLQSPSTMLEDNFGAAVAIVGDTAVVGAPLFDGPGFNIGAAYVFVRNGTTWTQQAQLVPPINGDGYAFGTSIAFDGDTIAIGAPGSGSTQPGHVFTFGRNMNTWDVRSIVTSPVSVKGDAFGASVSLSGDFLFIGAPNADGLGATAGAAFVFLRSGFNWIEQKRFDSPTNGPNRSFGRAVAVNGLTALISELPISMGQTPGLVHVVEFDGADWTFRTTLEASEPNPNDDFGWNLALGIDRAVVGARRANVDGQSLTGAAYVFGRDGTGWSFEERIAEPMPEADAYFGANMALSAEWLVIGRPGYGQAFSPGAAYVFKEQLLAQGTSCANTIQCANGFTCVDGVCCDVPCLGQPDDCLACSQMAGGLVDGTCGPAIAGTVCRSSVGICDSKELCDGIMTECPPDMAVEGCVDTDSDGISNTDEILFGANPQASDSDNDGVPDGLEPDWNIDTDRDGLINALDRDSDNDGLEDGLEVNQLMTDPLDSDTDDDCLTDGEEDGNHSGTIETFETDPRIPDFEGTCCTVDADCGTYMSGSVCGNGRQCGPGCRGTNGNTCPPGAFCSSIDNEPGQCITDSPFSSSNVSTSGTGGNGGGGGAGATVGGGDVGCDCRLSTTGELPRSAFFYAACVIAFVRRRIKNTQTFASAKSSATTRRPRGEHP